MFVGSKPNFNVLLTPIISKLKDLEYGIKIGGQDTRFFVLMGVFDKPARAAILNTKLATGFYGCMKCLVRGKTIKTGSKSMLN